MDYLINQLHFKLDENDTEEHRNHVKQMIESDNPLFSNVRSYHPEMDGIITEENKEYVNYLYILGSIFPDVITAARTLGIKPENISNVLNSTKAGDLKHYRLLRAVDLGLTELPKKEEESKEIKQTFYHYEGNETFIESGEIPLSMETLDNERFLFLARDSNSWNAIKLKTELRKVEVEIDTSKLVVFKTNSWYTYSGLFYYSTIQKKFLLTDDGKLLVKKGFNCFEVTVDNDLGETPELFIINPKEVVTDIK